MTATETPIRRLRKFLGRSRPVLWIGAGPVVAWLRLCRATTRWTVEGEDTLRAALREGPVIYVCWHEHALLATPFFPARDFPVASLRADSPIGRLGGLVQEAFGMQPVAMPSGQSNLAGTRAVLAGLRQGRSAAIAADGPRGPARKAKDAPLDWAAASGRPVFFFGYATRRQRRLSSWDRMVVPMPRDRGIAIYRRWEGQVPRRQDKAQRAATRAAFDAALDALRQEAEARIRG